MGSLTEAMALSQGNAHTDAKGIVQNGGGSGKALFAVDTAGFSAVLNRIVKETNRSASETVRYGMIQMLTAGRAATRKGKKTRKIIKGDRFSGMWDRFEVWDQGSTKPREVYLPGVKKIGGMTTAQQQKNYAIRQDIIKRLTPIERVGLAKASWGWAMKKFCGTGSVRLPGRVQNDPITGIKLPLSITVENKLWWINKLVPGIEQLMVTKATKKMLFKLENNLKRAFARAAGV
jgi:hypothetical protein